MIWTLLGPTASCILQAILCYLQQHLMHDRFRSVRSRIGPGVIVAWLKEEMIMPMCAEFGNGFHTIS